MIKTQKKLRASPHRVGPPAILQSVAERPDVVIGLGNEIMGDDGVGIEVARRLERRLCDNPDVEVVALPWAGFALLDLLAGRRRAAIIDCLCTAAYPPGAIVRLDENDFRGSVRLNSFHDLSYPAALALGRKLGWQIPDAIAIWGIEGAVVDRFSEALTPPVAAAVDAVVSEVLAFLGWVEVDRQQSQSG